MNQISLVGNLVTNDLRYTPTGRVQSWRASSRAGSTLLAEPWLAPFAHTALQQYASRRRRP